MKIANSLMTVWLLSSVFTHASYSSKDHNNLGFHDDGRKPKWKEKRNFELFRIPEYRNHFDSYKAEALRLMIAEKKKDKCTTKCTITKKCTTPCTTKCTTTKCTTACTTKCTTQCPSKCPFQYPLMNYAINYVNKGATNVPKRTDLNRGTNKWKKIRKFLFGPPSWPFAKADKVLEVPSLNYNQTMGFGDAEINQTNGATNVIVQDGLFWKTGPSRMQGINMTNNDQINDSGQVSSNTLINPDKLPQKERTDEIPINEAVPQPAQSKKLLDQKNSPRTNLEQKEVMMPKNQEEKQEAVFTEKQMVQPVEMFIIQEHNQPQQKQSEIEKYENNHKYSTDATKIQKMNNAYINKVLPQIENMKNYSIRWDPIKNVNEKIDVPLSQDDLNQYLKREESVESISENKSNILTSDSQGKENMEMNRKQLQVINIFRPLEAPYDSFNSANLNGESFTLKTLNKTDDHLKLTTNNFGVGDNENKLNYGSDIFLRAFREFIKRIFSQEDGVQILENLLLPPNKLYEKNNRYLKNMFPLNLNNGNKQLSHNKHSVQNVSYPSPYLDTVLLFGTTPHQILFTEPGSVIKEITEIKKIKENEIKHVPTESALREESTHMLLKHTTEANFNALKEGTTHSIYGAPIRIPPIFNNFSQLPKIFHDYNQKNEFLPTIKNDLLLSQLLNRVYLGTYTSKEPIQESPLQHETNNSIESPFSVLTEHPSLVTNLMPFKEFVAEKKTLQQHVTPIANFGKLDTNINNNAQINFTPLYDDKMVLESTTLMSSLVALTNSELINVPTLGNNFDINNANSRRSEWVGGSGNMLEYPMQSNLPMYQNHQNVKLFPEGEVARNISVMAQDPPLFLVSYDELNPDYQFINHPLYKEKFGINDNKEDIKERNVMLHLITRGWDENFVPPQFRDLNFVKQENIHDMNMPSIDKNIIDKKSDGSVNYLGQNYIQYWLKPQLATVKNDEPEFNEREEFREQINNQLVNEALEGDTLNEQKIQINSGVLQKLESNSYTQEQGGQIKKNSLYGEMDQLKSQTSAMLQEFSSESAYEMSNEFYRRNYKSDEVNEGDKLAPPSNDKFFHDSQNEKLLANETVNKNQLLPEPLTLISNQNNRDNISTNEMNFFKYLFHPSIWEDLKIGDEPLKKNEISAVQMSVVKIVHNNPQILTSQNLQPLNEVLNKNYNRTELKRNVLPQLLSKLSDFISIVKDKDLEKRDIKKIPSKLVSVDEDKNKLIRSKHSIFSKKVLPIISNKNDKKVDCSTIKNLETNTSTLSEDENNLTNVGQTPAQAFNEVTQYSDVIDNIEQNNIIDNWKQNMQSSVNNYYKSKRNSLFNIYGDNSRKDFTKLKSANLNENSQYNSLKKHNDKDMYQNSKNIDYIENNDYSFIDHDEYAKQRIIREILGNKRMKSQELEYILENNLPGLSLNKRQFIRYMMTGTKSAPDGMVEAEEKQKLTKVNLQNLIDRNSKREKFSEEAPDKRARKNKWRNKE